MQLLRFLTPFSRFASEGVYDKNVLNFYDMWVIRFSNTYAWKCPAATQQAFYNRHITGNHLDVGVGTGFYLKHAKFPTQDPQVTLLDLNDNCLEVTRDALPHLQPKLIQKDLMKPFELSQSFDSIGISYVFHCLPGGFKEKSVAIASLKTGLSDKGVLFGTTIMGQDVEHNALAKRLIKIYNKKGLFGNQNDSVYGLESMLHEHFAQISIKTVGCVAMFSARGPKR